MACGAFFDFQGGHQRASLSAGVVLPRQAALAMLDWNKFEF
jgi:hypothetical protein